MIGEFREKSLNQRHKTLVGATKQFRNDRNHFNGRRGPDKQLLLSLDFEKMPDESEQDETYHPQPHNEDDWGKFQDGMVSASERWLV